MISDIRSTLNTSSDKQNTGGTVSNHTGTLAKLMSELKFIENMSLIKFQGSETLNHQGKSVQLLHATGSQQAFTLINTGPSIDISDIKSAKLNTTNPQQAILSTTKETVPSQTEHVKTPSVSRSDNLTLASRVVNLTVISTPMPTGNSNTPTTTNQATSVPLAHSAQANTIQSNTTTTGQAQSTDSIKNTQTLLSTGSTSSTTNNTILGNPNQQNTKQAPIGPNNVTSTSQALTASGTTPQSPIQSNGPMQNTSIQSNTTQTSGTPFLVTVTDGKAEFPILSQTELKRGDVVRVLVDTNNQMQALPPKASPSATPLHMEALKQSLPKQLSLNDMSQLVKQLNTMSESSNLPPQTQQALKQLVQSMPTLAGLTSSPEAMKQAIQTSGVFTESLLLADNKTQLPEDLKLNLSRLRDIQENTGALRLGTIPTEQIANAIERITTTQLRHFSDANQTISPTYPLHIELPIRNGLTQNLVQIEINKDSGAQNEKKQDRRWLVKLKFDFEETGKFEARTSIQANKVSIIFVAEEAETLHKLKQNMSTLKEQLRGKDIEVERLDTFQAKLANTESSLQTHNKPLIDVRT